MVESLKGDPVLNAIKKGRYNYETNFKIRNKEKGLETYKTGLFVVFYKRDLEDLIVVQDFFDFFDFFEVFEDFREWNLDLADIFYDPLDIFDCLDILE